MFDEIRLESLSEARDAPFDHAFGAGPRNALADFHRVLDAGLAGVLRDPCRAAGRYARRLQNHIARRAPAPSTQG
mgnify:CR=1 FL=1